MPFKYRKEQRMAARPIQAEQSMTHERRSTESSYTKNMCGTTPRAKKQKDK